MNLSLELNGFTIEVVAPRPLLRRFREAGQQLLAFHGEHGRLLIERTPKGSRFTARLHHAPRTNEALGALLLDLFATLSDTPGAVSRVGSVQESPACVA